MANWWTRPARDEDKGSFSDTTSEVTYHNESKKEAIESKESAVRRGDDVVEDGYEVEDYGDRVRFNSNRCEVDGQDNEYEPKFKPGK